MHAINYVIFTILLLSQWPSVPARTIHQSVQNSSSQSPSKVSKYTEKSEYGGLTWDPCHHDKDCRQPRTCRKFIKDGESKECDTETGCVCDVSLHDFETCMSDDDCETGEFCLVPFEGSVGSCFSRNGKRGGTNKGKGIPSSPPPEDLSKEHDDDGDDRDKNITPSPDHWSGNRDPQDSQSKGRHCIGVHMLAKLSRDSLVYRDHVEALVLCDRFDSCATAGHVVIVNGSTMMMSSYCIVVGCQQRIMLVNSPKERGVKIESRSSGLVFTGYSARYETWLEEGLFRLLTTLGL